MNNSKINFEYIKRFWYLKDGIVYSKRTGKALVFSFNTYGRQCRNIKVNGKGHKVYIHDAIFMLHHNRPIAEGKEIHHRDWNHQNNDIENLIEITPTQHKRIHKYQTDDPMRGIILCDGLWRFQWQDDNGRQRCRRFYGINEAMTFRAEIERPRRQELRALGLNCKRVGSGEKSRAITASKFYFSRSNTNL